MYDSDDHFLHSEEEKPRRLLTRGITAVLLITIFCGLVAAPVAIYRRWTRTQTADDVVPLTADIYREEVDIIESVDRIAFITPDFQLETISPEGKDQRRLTSGGLPYSFPAWSPDSTQLAVIGGDGLYVLPDAPNADEEGLARQLYSNRSRSPFYIYWSPNGNQVTFLANHPEGIGLHLADIGQGDSRLLTTGQPFYWDWLPGADQLLVHTGASSRDSKLELINTSGSGRGNDIAQPGIFQSPGISQSGLYWAFAETNEDGISRVIVQDQSEERQLVEPHRGQVYMSWSPVNDLLGYASPSIRAPSRYGPLRLFDSKTGTTETIVNNQVVAFFWAPDGQSIAYLSLAEPTPGGVQATGNEKRLVRSRVQDQHPDIQFDLWTVDISDKEPNWLATFEPPAVFITQFLPYFDQYSLSHQLWSPDSNSLVIPMIRDGKSQITIVSVDDGSLRPIAEGQIGFWSPS